MTQIPILLNTFANTRETVGQEYPILFLEI